jgi:hypothetical protein
VKRSTSVRSSSTLCTAPTQSGAPEEVVQRRVKPVGVAGQPVAEEGQQFAHDAAAGVVGDQRGIGEVQRIQPPSIRAARCHLAHMNIRADRM